MDNFTTNTDRHTSDAAPSLAVKVNASRSVVEGQDNLLSSDSRVEGAKPAPSRFLRSLFNDQFFHFRHFNAQPFFIRKRDSFSVWLIDIHDAETGRCLVRDFPAVGYEIFHDGRRPIPLDLVMLATEFGEGRS